MDGLDGLKAVIMEAVGFGTLKRERFREIDEGRREHNLLNDDDDDSAMGIIATPMVSYPNRSNKLEPKTQLMASSKDEEKITELMAEGLLKYGFPGAIVGVLGTFILRRRSPTMKANAVEGFLLGSLHYYGATSLGLGIGMSLYGPTFNKKVLETMPHSDLARAIRSEQSRSGSG